MINRAAMILVRPIMSEPIIGPNTLKCQPMNGLLETRGVMVSAPGPVILKDAAQSSITINPTLHTRKGISRSVIQAATLVRLLLAFLSRPLEKTWSGLSRLAVCSDGNGLIIASHY